MEPIRQLRKEQLVSVIMPAWNAEKYIAESIKSVRNQTYQNWELLVIDDSSTDRTAEIIQKFAAQDSRIKYLNNLHSKGIVGALNSGLEAAKGDFIARLDADDLAVITRLQQQVDFLVTYQDIVIVGGGYTPFTDTEIADTLLLPVNSLILRLSFCVGSFFCHPSVMFRRSLLTEFSSYPNVVAEDYAFFSEILNKYKGSNLQVETVKYRVHGSNLSLVLKEDNLKSTELISQQNIEFLGGEISWLPELGKFIRVQKLTRQAAIKTSWRAIKLLDKIRRLYNYRLWSYDYLYSLAYVIKRLIKQLTSNL